MNKVLRWRCVDIQARIAALFGVALHECSVGRLLTRLSVFRRGKGTLLWSAPLAVDRLSELV